MTVRESTPLRLVLTLAVAGLFSGLVLVSVYLLTAPRIQRNQAEALRRAIFTVLPGTATIDTYVVRDGRLVPYDGPEGSIPTEQAAFAGISEAGESIGFAVPAGGPGFMDTIKLLYGFDPARRVIVGMQVLESRETPGLGDKIVTDPVFLANFAALAVEPAIVPVKKGKKANPNEVDCITGATISSEAVVNILNRSTDEWIPVLENPAAPVEVSKNDAGPTR